MKSKKKKKKAFDSLRETMIHFLPPNFKFEFTFFSKRKEERKNNQLSNNKL